MLVFLECRVGQQLPGEEDTLAAKPGDDDLMFHVVCLRVNGPITRVTAF